MERARIAKNSKKSAILTGLAKIAKIAGSRLEK